MNTTKYKKVEILKIIHSTTWEMNQLEKLEFENCGLVITGDFLIIVTDDIKNRTTTGKIYKMIDIDGYKTYELND